nr:MAG TPA: hypothetical protein [Bacteriophage sp.]
MRFSMEWRLRSWIDLIRKGKILNARLFLRFNGFVTLKRM